MKSIYKIFLGVSTSIIPIGIIGGTIVSCGHKKSPSKNPTYADFKTAAGKESALNIVKQTNPTGWKNADSSSLKIVSHSDNGTTTYNVKISYTNNDFNQIANFTATYIADQSYQVSDWVCTGKPTTFHSFYDYKKAINDIGTAHLWLLLYSYNINHPKALLPHINAYLNGVSNLKIDANKTKFDTTSEANTVIFDLWLTPKLKASFNFENEIKLRAVWNNSVYNITDWSLNYTFSDFSKSLSSMIAQSDFVSDLIALKGAGGTKWTNKNTTMKATPDSTDPNRINYVLSFIDDQKITETLPFYAKMGTTVIGQTTLNHIFGTLGYEGEIQGRPLHPKYDDYAYFVNETKEWSNNNFGNFTVCDVLKQINTEHPGTLPKNWSIYVGNRPVSSKEFTATMATDISPNPDKTKKQIHFTIKPPSTIGNNADLERFNVTVTEPKAGEGGLVPPLGLGDFAKSAIQPPDVKPAALASWLQDAKKKLTTYKDNNNNWFDGIAEKIQLKNKDGHLHSPNLQKLCDANLAGSPSETDLRAVVTSVTDSSTNVQEINFTLNFYKSKDINYKTAIGGPGGIFSFDWPGGTTTTFDLKSIGTINVVHDIN